MFFSLPSVTRQTKLSCPQLNEQHRKQSKKRCGYKGGEKRNNVNSHEKTTVKNKAIAPHKRINTKPVNVTEILLSALLPL